MIFESDPSFASPWQRMETSSFIVEWCGFLFVRGCEAGRDSVACLLDAFASGEPAEILGRAKGSFAIRVFKKQTQETICAVDPFGLVRLFVSGNIISDDLIALLRRLGNDEQALDLSGIASFLRFGFYSFGRTIDRRIASLTGDQIIHIAKDGETRIAQKQFPASIEKPQPFDFDAYIADIILAMRNERVSLDLTGGYDSRLLAACLGPTKSVVECATSGPDENPEVSTAREVAQRLALAHFTTPHDSDVLEQRISTMLRLTNGQIGLLAYDRIYQLLRARQARGISLCISGVGGEFWKDILWLHDFPVIWGNPDFDRLYRMRIEPRAPHALPFEPAFAARFAGAGPEYLEQMRACFGHLPRTAAYDAVYAFLRIPFSVGPVVTSAIRSGVPTFCPLLDRDGIAASANMPKRERLFSRWHRETIRGYAPQIADLRTTDGLSSRTGVSLIADLPYYLGNKAARLAQKIAQRLNLPDVIQAGLNDPRSGHAARALTAGQDALSRLRSAGIMKPDMEPVPDAMYDRLLTTGLMLAEAAR